ncbi:hypothetical protein NPIL_336331 [Nephila pilipes]|uniref:Uncharacterized protein n=1 Tax=Nephila pilipes TaxID=299642 RepID=A0A8X6TXV5_NEPPI|nr:hypothetical protein NPIL_336331 [Nephila pilipes]
MEQDSNPDRSNYENFHNQFNIESIVQMMDNAYTAEALTRVINVADATLSALFKYPFEDDCPRNPANHPPKQKQPQPKPENSWRKRMNSAPPKTTAPRQNFAISEEDFPQLPTTSKQVQTPKSTQPSANNYHKINNPLEMLKNPDVQELYNVLEKFVNIAKNVPTPAERLQALFKLLN